MMKIPYIHGGDIYSRPVQMDYSANINPLGLPRGVKKELLHCIEENVCCIYPDSACRSLKNALSEIHHIPRQWISCGNGAADLIFALTAALKPVRALLPAPSFMEYSQALGLWGCETDWFMLREEEGFRLDSFRLREQLCRAQEEKRPYSILFLCNPNNPTGFPLKRETVEEIGALCSKMGTWLIADECFCDFLDEPDAYSVIPRLKELDHVVVLKAFTKIYAMAGLRLGYSLCSDLELNRRMEEVRQPWSVSGPAQRAGIAALKEKGYLEATKRLIGPERERMKRRLAELGLQVYPSQANYIFFRDPLWKEGRNLYECLLRRGVLIRSCGNYPGLNNAYYRICVKTQEENDCFLKYLTEAAGK